MLSDAQIWQHWLEWLPTGPPSDRPAPLFAHYRARLLQGGASDPDADHQMNTIRRMMRTEIGGWQVLFNNIYSSPTPGFNTNPNALLASAVEKRRPGRALDVSAGQGRNAVFLAIKGWDVTAVDIADEGLKIAARNAERAGVRIQTVQQSLDTFSYGSVTWDLMVMTYAPVPVTSPTYVTRISEALRPGGLVVVESYSSEASADGRRPIDIDPADLRRAFADFRIVQLTDSVTMPDWDTDAARLVQFIAEKQ